MLRKAISLQLKADSTIGEVTARFSVFNAIDKDKDVTLPGAFTQGAPVKIASYGHRLDRLPVGRGAIETDDFQAMMSGRFFLESTVGKDTYETVKQMGDLQEWSYEYDVLDASFGEFQGQQVRFLKSLKVHGVTPVYIGAGNDTGTLDIKGFIEQGEEAAAMLVEFTERAKARAQAREKEGRTLSSSNRSRLTALVESMTALQADLSKLLEETDPEKGALELMRLRADYLRQEARLNGVLV